MRSTSASGVARQWASWSRHPDFLISDGTAAALPPAHHHAGPLAAVYVPGDAFAPYDEMRRWLFELYPDADGAPSGCRSGTAGWATSGPSDLGPRRCGPEPGTGCAARRPAPDP